MKASEALDKANEIARGIRGLANPNPRIHDICRQMDPRIAPSKPDPRPIVGKQRP